MFGRRISRNGLFWAGAIFSVVVLLTVAILVARNHSAATPASVAFTDFLRDVDAGRVATVTVTAEGLLFERRDGTPFQTVAPQGYIATAARCNDGFPSHGNFRTLLMEHDSPEALLDTILAPGFLLYDQWEAQMLANIQQKARVGLLSELPDEDVCRAHLEPIHDIAAVVTREIARRGPDAAIAVLPEGPMTIPYLAP